MNLLPMLRSQLPQPPEPEGMSVEDVIAAAVNGSKPGATLGGASKPKSPPAGQIAVNGVPVQGSQVILVTDRDGTVTGVFNYYDPRVADVDGVGNAAGSVRQRGQLFMATRDRQVDSSLQVTMQTSVSSLTQTMIVSGTLPNLQASVR